VVRTERTFILQHSNPNPEGAEAEGSEGRSGAEASTGEATDQHRELTDAFVMQAFARDAEAAFAEMAGARV
jgi:hypothetical protein